MSGTFQFLIVLAFVLLPVVIFAVIARSFLRRLRNRVQLGHEISMAIKKELHKAGIDPSTVKLQTATSASGMPEETEIRLDALTALNLPPEVMKAIQKAAFRTLLFGSDSYTGDTRSQLPRGPVLPTPIDAPSGSGGRLALIVLLVGFGMVVALMLRETL